MQQDEARLESLARQYSWLRQRGESHDKAVELLHQNVDAAFSPILQRFSHTQQNDPVSDPFIADKLGELKHIFDRPSLSKEQRTSMLLGALDLNNELRNIGRTIREQILVRYSYMAFVSIVGIVISVIYSLFVYPQMTHMAKLLGNQFTTYNTPIYYLGGLGYPVVFVCLLVITLLMYFFSVRGSYQLGSGKNFAAPVHFFPGFAQLNEALKSFLHIGLQRVYARSSFDAAQSDTMARETIEVVNPFQQEALALAWKLDTLENEFAHLHSQARAKVELALDTATSVWHRVLTIVTTIIVLMMVSDYYRPLFTGAGGIF